MSHRHQPRIHLCGTSGCRFRARNHGGLTQHQHALHPTIQTAPAAASAVTPPPSPSQSQHEQDVNDLDLPDFGTGHSPDPPSPGLPEPFPEQFTRHIECHPLLNGGTLDILTLFDSVYSFDFKVSLVI
jgi:hypothetical protein